MADQLDFVRRGGASRRFHTMPVLHQQRIDSHSFNVAMIYAMIAMDRAEPPGLTAPGLMAALTHDLAEHVTGDLPAPAKRALDNMLPGARKAWDELERQILVNASQDWEHLLSPVELRWLKLADALEGAFYCIEERAMGNQIIAEAFHNFRRYIGELDKGDEEEPAVRDMIMKLDQDWSNAHGN